MDRRSSIKTLFIISAGTALLPSCLQEDEKPSVSLQKIKINKKEENLIAELSETIIPKTDTPGAKDLSAHLFVLMMVDECASPDEQKQFEKGLKEFDTFSKKKFDKPFLECSATERTEILKSIEEKKGVPENVSFFYDAIRWFTLTAYTTSEYYLTKVHEYKLVPGKFYGCVPVKKAS